ncbi:MAG: hypothetical protein LBP62_07260 [Clostridiales bacterium]|nr:hypothetical protein [Clostridiales bacterium]
MSEENNAFNGESNPAVSYGCSSCGGALEYSPEKGALCCPYCGNTEEVARGESAERDFLSHASSSEGWAEEAFAYSCPNCGSAQVIEKDDLTHVCPFCGTQAVLNSGVLTGIKPDSLIPFSLPRTKAEEAFKAWTKSRFFLPNALKKRADADKYHGVFMPVWTFDDKTFSDYEGLLGKHYTVTVGSGKNRRTEVRTRYFSIKGSVSEFFDDVCINASDKIEKKHLNKIMPYDTNNGVKYDKKFLAGFSAIRYNKDIKTAWAEAKDNIAGRLRALILSKYNYDVVSRLNIQTRHTNITFKYILLPVWVSNFKYNSKIYNFFINGISGKVSGKRPYSAPKILAAIGGGLAAAGLLFFLISKLAG